jgi:drug/metabolite transporter (DMT)-like permease
MRDPLPTKNESRSAAFVGILLLTVGNGCVVWAEQYIQSGLAALLIGTTPLWMILLQILLPFGRKPSIQGIVAVLIGFIGLVILFWPELRPGGGQGNFLAYLVVILGTVSWAFGSLYSRSANLPKSPLMGTALEMLAGGAGLVILGGISGEFGNIHPEYFSLRSLLSLSYLIIFGSLVGFVAYTWLLRSAPISLVSTYAYVNPVVALLLGSFLANEVLTGRTILAAVIILFAVIFLSVTNSRKSSLRAISDG